VPIDQERHPRHPRAESPPRRYAGPMRPVAGLRSVVVLAACAYAVHSLRYLLAYGANADSAQLAQGHGYLTAAPVALTALLAVAAGQLVLRIARGGGGARGAPAPLGRLWWIAATALLAIFTVQELTEGWLAAGHPGGVAAIFANGGWLAVPLSAAGGLLVALLHRGAEAALAAAHGTAPSPTPRPPLAPAVWCRPHAAVSRVPGPWLGGRGPPALAG
jgi:hypothetical protein